MRKLFNIVTIWLLLTAAFCSCSKDMDLDGDYSIIISGTVSESVTSLPIEGVMIRFKAIDSERKTELKEKNVYTDSKGEYRIESSGFSRPLTCTLDVVYPGFKEIRKTILVNWSGPSYNEENNTFFVNDMDFHMEE